MEIASVPARESGLFGWWRAADDQAHRALIAASLGWMLDAFDVMLYAMVVAALIDDLGLTKTQAGLLGSITLLAGAAGGFLFGVVADRYGRTRALMGSVLLYSIFTALCGLAQTVWQLAIFRTFLGLGMGGEWASGAALVSETWPAEHRGKAFGFMQSSWAIGYAAAALVTAIVLPRWGWRAVFFVGVLPALLTVWVQRRVEEPAMWRERRRTASSRSARSARLPPSLKASVDHRSLGGGGQPSDSTLSLMFRGGMARVTIAVTAMNACTLFGWWGLNAWIPAYLSLPVTQGGIGLSAAAMAGLVVAMQVGMWFGYVSFGFIGDVAGRKRAYVIYLLAASVLLPLYGAIRSPMVLLALGPLVAFFGTGYFSGFGALTAELYPTAIRATAQGLTYNTGRIASAAAPYVVGSLATSSGFGLAFLVTGSVFLLAAMAWVWIPETRGRELA